MDGRVPKSLSGLENVSCCGTIAEFVCDGRRIVLYLAVTPYAVRSALIREEGRVQKPVYYTSKTLRGAEG